jgi:ABC-2 type transport system ATP-binding protein
MMREAGRVTVAIRVRGLVKSYRGRAGDVRANDGIDLDVTAGEVFGLLGPNGAGKTTLVRQLAGIARPDAGTVELLGTDIGREPAVAAQLAAHLAQDEPALAELSVSVAVETTARLRGTPRRAAATVAAAVMDELGIAGLADRPLQRLSGGQRRLACVAAALATDRPILLLDEPTAGLDPVARRTVWAAVERRRAERGVTVVLVTHNVLEAETVLDRVAILDQGKVIGCDSPGRLKASIGEEVRLDLVWRSDPPLDDPTVRRLASSALVTGRRWRATLPQPAARAALADLTSGPAFAALDDFTLATPTLEDVYLALGGDHDDLERV